MDRVTENVTRRYSAMIVSHKCDCATV